MIGGKTAASDKDTKEILKITVNPPLDAESLSNLKTIEVHASFTLPEGSAFLEHLRKTIKKFEGFESIWRSHEMSDPALQKFKAILHLKFLTHR